MKRICLLFVLLYYAFSNVHGQIRFSKFYDYKHTANLISDVVVLGDTGYFTVSQCVDLNEIDTLNFVKTHLYFIRIDEYGDTLFTKAYHRPRFNNKGADLLKAPWGYLLAGEEFDLKKFKENNIGSHIKVWKIKNNGDTISTLNYDIQIGDEFSMSVIATLDGGYAIFGQTCNQIQSGKKCNYFLMKLDSNGNKQWHQIYKQSSTSFENPNSVIQLPDGTFYLFGQSTLNSIMKWFLVKTDNVGNLLWQKTYNEYPRQAGMDIIAVDYNKILLVGGYAKNIDGSGTGRACSMLIDSSGNKIWSKSYGGAMNCGFKTTIKSKNAFFLVGTNSNFDSLDNSQGWLLAVDLNGDSLFQRLYNPVSIWPETIYGIKQTSEGFVMSGYGITKNDSINSQDAWFLKVDSFGCLTPGCQLVGINNIPFSREEINIYPNPAKDKIQFRHTGKIISYRIADYSGKLLLAGNYLESGINVETLSMGTYIVQVLLEGKVQAFGRLLVER